MIIIETKEKNDCIREVTDYSRSADHDCQLGSTIIHSIICNLLLPKII